MPKVSRMRAKCHGFSPTFMENRDRGEGESMLPHCGNNACSSLFSSTFASSAPPSSSCFSKKTKKKRNVLKESKQPGAVEGSSNMDLSSSFDSSCSSCSRSSLSSSSLLGSSLRKSADQRSGSLHNNNFSSSDHHCTYPPVISSVEHNSSSTTISPLSSSSPSPPPRTSLSYASVPPTLPPRFSSSTFPSFFRKEEEVTDDEKSLNTGKAKSKRRSMKTLRMKKFNFVNYLKKKMEEDKKRECGEALADFSSLNEQLENVVSSMQNSSSPNTRIRPTSSQYSSSSCPQSQLATNTTVEKRDGVRTGRECANKVRKKVLKNKKKKTRILNNRSNATKNIEIETAKGSGLTGGKISRKMRRKIAKKEMEKFEKIVDLDVFRKQPCESIRQHIHNTLVLQSRSL